MGACQDSGADRTSEYDSNAQTMNAGSWCTGRVSRSELKTCTIEIGEAGFKSPLLRNQMLAEDFSHIYDKNFATQFNKSILKLQACVRMYLTKKSYKEFVSRQEIHEEIHPRPYFSTAENKETI